MANWNPTVKHALRYDRPRAMWVVTSPEKEEDDYFSDRNEARRYLRLLNQRDAREG